MASNIPSCGIKACRVHKLLNPNINPDVHRMLLHSLFKRQIEGSYSVFERANLRKIAKEMSK